MYSPFVDGGADLEDKELVASAQSGDRQALEDLVVRHQPWVYNIAVRMLLWTDAAEDATQDILIKMITGLGAFRHRSKFRTWLYRIAVNHILNLKKEWVVAEAPYTYDYFARDPDTVRSPPKRTGATSSARARWVQGTHACQVQFRHSASRLYAQPRHMSSTSGITR